MGRNINPPLPTRTHALSRKLRKSSTDAEALIWYHLRGGRLGAKFRRQHPIPPYVLDFYCVQLKLAIELDGSSHSPEVDAERTRYLRAQGIQIVRFWDNQVLIETKAVLEQIHNMIQSRTLTPTPLPTGEGLKAESV